MKNKFIKIILVILIPILIVIVVFFIYGSIMSLGNSRMPIVEISKELRELENIIGKETKSNDHTYFNPIPKYEIEKCNAKLPLNVYVNNDSLSQSKKTLDEYINSISKRVNKQLIDKKCIDSLIIEVSAYNSQEKIDSMKTKHYRYSFPIK